jgi:hypothetical protein
MKKEGALECGGCGITHTLLSYFLLPSERIRGAVLSPRPGHAGQSLQKPKPRVGHGAMLGGACYESLQHTRCAAPLHMFANCS